MSSSEGQDMLGRMCADLKRLKEECRDLTLISLARACNRSDAQLSTILNGGIKRLPDRELILNIVGKFDSYARDHQIRLSISTDRAYWEDFHAAVERSLAGGPATPAKTVRQDPWIDLVEQHVENDAVVLHAVAIARHLAAQRRTAEKKLKGDPWLDPDLASRVVDRAAALAAEASLTGFEQALVVITPMAHQVRWLNAAALTDVDPLDLRQTGANDPDRADFERFLLGRQQHRLVTRATQRGLSDRTADSAKIGWWLLHRWLDTRPPDHRVSDRLTDVIDDRRRRAMLVEPLDGLVRLFRLPAGELSSSERLDLPAVSGGSLGMPGVRVRLVGLLLAVAHSLAIEIATLSSTIVEHLGIPEPVDLAGLRDTLSESDWEPSDSNLDIRLVARCRHEAVLEALTEHVGRTDILLGAVRSIAQHDTTLQPLRALPTRASADRVLPAVDDGKPLFTFPVARFRLDETRVRELLMGEQLYRDRSLAIRELYQNALDACRYRKARHAYQAKTSGWSNDWNGEILFDQGVDEAGRRYLRCKDDGVGMSELDLREVFSQAGVRFADRPEFVEEQAEWAEHGVELYPNSRFGIGVMSYFMLADEIEVTTCRMDRRTATHGPELKVVIAGPGHLFRVKQIAEDGKEPGTTVKLYLRDGEEAPSCVRTLRALLGIAEFRTCAKHEGVVAEWEPFVFQPRERQSWETGGINAYGQLEPHSVGEHGQVIWCEYGGALLADGIYVQANEHSQGLLSRSEDHDPRGAVINLAGSWAPVLTVDRMSVLGNVSDRILTLLAECTAPLLEPESSLLSYQWITDIAWTSPDIADLITTAAADRGATLYLGDHEIDVRRAGVLALDAYLTETPGIWRRSSPGGSRWIGADHLVLWRLVALIDDALGSAVEYSQIESTRDLRAALPSDIAVIGSVTSGDYELDPPDSPGLVARKATLIGCEFGAMIERLAELGLADADLVNLSSIGRLDATDTTILSTNLTGEYPWLSTDQSVTYANLIAASVRTQLPPTQVRKRLIEFGFDVEPLVDLTISLDSTDSRIVSRNLDSGWPWLDRSSPVPALHVARAAKVTHQPFAAVAARLTRLGFTVSDILCEPHEIDDMDPRAQSAIAILTSHFLQLTYSYPQAVKAAVKANYSPAALGRSLAHLGVQLSGPGSLPDELDHDTRMLVSLADSGSAISLKDVLNIANKTEMSLHTVRDRLVELGFNPTFSSDSLDSLDDIGRSIAVSEGYQIYCRSQIPLTVVVELAATLAVPLATLTRSLHAMGCRLPETGHLPAHLREGDARLLRRSEISADAIPVTKPVPLAHLARVAHTRLLEPKAVAGRLGQLGYRVPASDEIPEQFAQQDVRLLSWPMSSLGRKWQDPYEPVPIGDLIRAALRCRVSITAAAERMVALGLEVPDLRVELPPLLAKLPRARGGQNR